MNFPKENGENPLTREKCAKSGISGGIAGVISCILFQPLDVIRTRQQQFDPGSQKSFRCVISDIYKQNGMKGFWRGSVPTLLRVAPGTSIYFAALDPLCQTWHTFSKSCNTVLKQCNSDYQLNQSTAPAWYFGGVSAFARGTAVFLLNPIAIVKTRMESSLIDSKAENKRMTMILRDLISHEPIRFYFKGAWATVCRDVPFSALFLTFYTILRENIKTENSIYKNFLSGAIAGASASTLTHPFDVVRTRQQLMGVKHQLYIPEGHHYGIFKYLKLIIRDEGFSAIWTGLTVRIVKRSFMAAMVWTSFEEIKRFLIHK